MTIIQIFFHENFIFIIDTVFATQLLNKCLNEQLQTSTSADLDDDNIQFTDESTDTFIDEEFLSTEDTAYHSSETQDSEGIYKQLSGV